MDVSRSFFENYKIILALFVLSNLVSVRLLFVKVIPVFSN